MQLKQSILEIDNEKIVCETLIRQDNVAILHGAGAAERKRYYWLAQEILSRGFGVILFDFPGHGDSSGELGDQSLGRRCRQAQQVIDSFLPESGDLYLAGFSMSGQTACDLIPIYKDKVPAILLGCPGVYSNSVQDRVFGGEEFTKAIRVLASWKDSSAFSALRDFNGKTVIAIGDEDKVIPNELVENLRDAARDHEYVEYVGVDHQLASWLAKHDSEQNRLLDLLFINCR